MNFSVSSPGPTEKKRVFLCVYFFFLCGLTHRKISFNLGEHNFSVCETYRKFISDGELIEFFFCHYIFVGIFLRVHRQKNIFLTVFVFFRGFLHAQKNSRFQ